LAPHEQRLLDFPDLLNGQAQADFSEALVGGIVLDYSAAPSNALNTSGWIEDINSGFSTMLSFHDAAENQSAALLGNQVLLRNPLDGTELSTHLLLWNTGTSVSSVDARFIYQRAAQAITTTIPLAPLNPNEIRSIDVSEFARAEQIPTDVREGMIVASFAGNNGQVMGRVFAASADGSYGYYWRLKAEGLRARALGVYWNVEDGWDTLLSLTNAGDRADSFTINLTYNGGVVSLPSVTLQPFQSTSWSLRDWFAAEGHALPPNIGSGGIRVTSDRADSRLLFEEYSINRELRLATPFYVSAPEILGMGLDPSPLVIPVGGSGEVTETVVENDNNSSPPRMVTVIQAIGDASIQSPYATFAQDSNSKWLLTGVIPGVTVFTVTIDKNLAPGVGPITRSITVDVLPAPTVTIQRPITLIQSSGDSRARATLGATASDVGSFQWTSSDTTKMVLDNAGSAQPTLRVLDFPARARIKVVFRSQYGQTVSDTLDFVVTEDVTAITFIHQPTLPPTPPPANPALRLIMNTNTLCAVAFASWLRAAVLNTDEGVPRILFPDRPFVNNYTFQLSFDSFNPASDLGGDPSAFILAKHNFRSGQRFQAYFEVRNGVIDQGSVNYLNMVASVGTSKSPCGFHAILDGDPIPDPNANNKRFLSPAATSISQVSGGRVAREGQAVDTYINDRFLAFPFCNPGLPIPCFGVVGLTTPWIWNQIEFDLDGKIIGPTFGAHTSIFSMPIYTRQTTSGPTVIRNFSVQAGQNLQNFIDKDVTYRFVIPAGAIPLP